MKGIGGNLIAKIQVRSIAENDIGEQEETWLDELTVRGWLDLRSGDSAYSTYSAKIQESTHIWVMDYVQLPNSISAENARMVIAGQTYDVMLIDNPMELRSGSQLEIFLKFTGGQ